MPVESCARGFFIPSKTYRKPNFSKPSCLLPVSVPKGLKSQDRLGQSIALVRQNPNSLPDEWLSGIIRASFWCHFLILSHPDPSNSKQCPRMPRDVSDKPRMYWAIAQPLRKLAAFAAAVLLVAAKLGIVALTALQVTQPARNTIRLDFEAL